MPYLVKKIEGQILDNFTGEVRLIKNIKSEIGIEDYLKVNTFEAFTQNFKKVTEVEVYPLLTNFGLKNNTSFIELKISY